MMTFVNMYSPGLKILATHRLVNGVKPEFLPEGFLRAASEDFEVEEIHSLDVLKDAWTSKGSSPARTAIGAAMGSRLFLLQSKKTGELDVRVLHQHVLEEGAGSIGEEAVRDEKHLRYIRGIEPALEEARHGTAQIAFSAEADFRGPVSGRDVFRGGCDAPKIHRFLPQAPFRLDHLQAGLKQRKTGVRSFGRSRTREQAVIGSAGESACPTWPQLFHRSGTLPSVHSGHASLFDWI